MDSQLLDHLTQTSSTSGNEEKIRDVIKTYIKDFVDEIHTDTLGSLVGLKRGNGEGKRMLLAAHMDEIGLMVTHVEEKGFARFTSIGGLRPITCVGSRVLFENGATGAIYVQYRESARMDC